MEAQMTYGVITLLPAILVILIAVKTRRTTESLLGGCLVSYLIISVKTKQALVPMMVDSFFSVLTDYDTIWPVVVCGLFGSLVAVINAAKGTHAIADFLGKVCKSKKALCWFLGCLAS